jgi:hypothetical protein
LIEYVKADEIGIDVYAWNDIGIKFWVSVGFKTKNMHMEYRRDED